MGTRGAARPTKADVARLANVSAATVSYVLNNVEGQSSQTNMSTINRPRIHVGPNNDR